MKICSKCFIEKPVTEFYKRGRDYKSHCKECSSLYGKKYYSENKEKHSLKMVEHYQSNIDEYKLNHKTYRENNKDKINEIAKIYNKNKRNNDILFKLKHNLRVRIREYLKSKNITKTNKTFDFVGCSPELLKNHLEGKFEGGMTWENYGKWEIDHKIPLSHATDVNELYKLNYYLNLQPMWKHDNIKKGIKII